MSPPRLLLAVLAAVWLGGCSDWLGQAPPPPLPGERLPVLPLEAELATDAELAGRDFSLPLPRELVAWPQSGGGPDHAAHHVAAPGPLREVWRADIGAGESRSRRLLATPVVARGRVFVLDAETTLSALDAATGAVLWRVDVEPADEDEGGWGGGLAFDEGRLVVATGYGEVIMLDAENGEERWRARLDAPLRTAPTVAADRVYVVSPTNTLSVLDAASGDLLWSHRGIEEIAGLLGGGGPAVSGSLVVVAYSSGEIYALRAENGQSVWFDTLGFSGLAGSLAALDDVNGHPVIDAGQAVAASHGGRMAAIDLATGARVWERELTSVQSPWVAGDLLFIVTVDARVACLLRRNGRVLWVTSLPQFEDPEDREDLILWSGPVLAGGRLLLAGSDGVLAEIAPLSGEILALRALGDGLPVAPVPAGGAVHLLLSSGDIVALR